LAIIVEKTKLDGVLLIKPSIFLDHRGTFIEIYNIIDYHTNGIKIEFVRDDISTSKKNVLRGIHYDKKTWKLIQCMHGKMFFVVVDMRSDSNRYLQWVSFNLDSIERNQVLVPPGFGNGHLVVSDECIFHYKMSEYYHPENEKILRWDDPQVNISWPIENPILSHKDEMAPFLKVRE
jgi:dTDP-4-dehydrorhamnose 3,5-epimerase